jgi:hypothetical protein
MSGCQATKIIFVLKADKAASLRCYHAVSNSLFIIQIILHIKMEAAQLIIFAYTALRLFKIQIWVPNFHLQNLWC